MTMDLPKLAKPEKIRLVEINSHLTCYLCKGYFIDATTISECLHSFCRSCLIKFLQENSHCPICEVLINKAKPNIKLDKTLQDIVYKLVPELFLNEMLRRQRFYQKHPEAAAKATPEDRGEDTERTIFNPRDSISLSIEYIREDSTPGAISLPPPSSSKNGTEGTKNGTVTATAANNNNDLESLTLRRYLQCPGMCRVEVLKKFICSKYNVDINKFYIEILYKRVPLPDHYTLIDIAYIYSWKRNEPMKFFFKIIDLDTNTDVSEDVEASSFPTKIIKPPKSKRKPLEKVKATGDNKNAIISSDNDKCDKKVDKNENNSSVIPQTIITSSTESSQKLDENKIENELKLAPSKRINNINQIDLRSSEKIDETKTKSDKRTEDVINVVRNGEDDLKKVNNSQKLPKEYTKITLNRNSNMEIITKVQQVSNKNGQPIGLKITKQLVKKPVIENNKTIVKKIQEAKKKMSPKLNGAQGNKKSTVMDVEIKAEVVESPKNDNVPEPEVDPEKSKFLESFELTARSSLSPQKQNPTTTNKIQPSPDVFFTKELDVQKSIFGATSSAQKRKTSSPMKNERASKKQKSLAGKTSPNKRKPESKNIPNPTVRQMVSNVHQSATNVSKIVEQSSPKSKCNKTDLQSLFDSCKINIPSSLSITIKEGTEDKNLPPVKPVKNYIEILKLPDTEQKLLRDSKELSLDDEYRERPKLNITVSTTSSTPNGGVQNGPKGDHQEEPKQFNNKLSKSSEETTTTTPVPTTKGQTTTKVVASTYVPEKVVNTTVPIKLAPLIANQSFQKMFEESIKKSNWSITTNSESASDKEEDDKNKTSNNINGTDETDSKLNNEKKPSQKIALDLTTDSNSSSNSSSNGLISSSSSSGSGGTNNKKNILEIATQLYKKSKMEQTKSTEDNNKQNKTSTPSRHIPATPTPNYTPSGVPLRLTQTLSNLHSASLGLNYTVSVTQNNSPKLSPKISVPSPNKSSKVPTADSKAKTSTGSSPKPPVSPPFNLSPRSSCDKGVKTTIATGSATGGLYTSGGFCIVSSKGDEPPAKVPRVSASPKNNSCGSDTAKITLASPKNISCGSDTSKTCLGSPKNNSCGSDTSKPCLGSPKNIPCGSDTSKTCLGSPKNNYCGSDTTKISLASPKSISCGSDTTKTCLGSPKNVSTTKSLSKSSSCVTKSASSVTKMSSPSPKAGSGSCGGQKQSSSKSEGSGGASAMNPNEILEKYNIQNLAQLTANFNFPISNQLAALHQAMILRHFEMQNRQNWFNMNPSPLVQYEKYLQSLSQKQGQILSKEN